MALKITDMPSKPKMVANILSTYFAASKNSYDEGMTWYNNAWDVCDYIAHKYDYTTYQIAGVMAVLSPAMVWNTNESAPERACILHREGVRAEAWPGFATYGNNRIKAQRILDGDWSGLSGRKIINFYGNIVGVTDIVTIDRWAIRVALNNPYLGENLITPSSQKAYDFLADAYIIAANMEGINPCDMQAITWVDYRNKFYGRAGNRYAPKEDKMYL